MLAADKLQLQSQIKQSATALKEKEFSLHHNNLMTVGTQAAVLAGLDITMFVEFHSPELAEFSSPNLARVLLFAYYGMIVGAFCSNVIVVSHTTTLSVLGGSLALRGPDGSMMTATDCLYRERASVFSAFAVGLALTMGSVLVGVWVLLQRETALLCWCVAVLGCRRMWKNYARVRSAFQYNEDETVDLRDLFEGVAGIQAIPTRLRPNRKTLSTSKASSLSGDDADGDEDEDSEEDDDDVEAAASSGSRLGRRRRGQRSALLPPQHSGPTSVKRRGSPANSGGSKALKSILTV